jgi:hypothetical protein
MDDITVAMNALRAAYNEGEPVGCRVRLDIRAVWERWCVSCRKVLRPSSKWRIVNNHIFCAACIKKPVQK